MTTAELLIPQPPIAKDREGWLHMFITEAAVRTSYMSRQVYLQLKFSATTVDGLVHAWWVSLRRGDRAERLRELGIETQVQEAIEKLQVAPPQFDVHGRPKVTVKGIVGKSLFWVLRERRGMGTGMGTSPFEEVDVPPLGASKVQIAAPFAVELMTAPRPRNYRMKHFRVAMHEKHVYLPGGRPAVLTACNDLAPAGRTIPYLDGQLKKPLPTCPGCMAFHDTWTEHPENWVPSVEVNTEMLMVHSMTTPLRRLGPPKLKPLTAENYFAFLKAIRVERFMPLKEAVR